MDTFWGFVVTLALILAALILLCRWDGDED